LRSALHYDKGYSPILTSIEWLPFPCSNTPPQFSVNKALIIQKSKALNQGVDVPPAILRSLSPEQMRIAEECAAPRLSISLEMKIKVLAPCSKICVLNPRMRPRNNRTQEQPLEQTLTFKSKHFSLKGTPVPLAEFLRYHFPKVLQFSEFFSILNFLSP